MKGRVNVDFGASFVREASTLALASQGFAFKLSLSLIISQAFFLPLKLKLFTPLDLGCIKHKE